MACSADPYAHSWSPALSTSPTDKMQRLTSSCSGLASLGQAAVTRALPQLLNLHTLPVFPESAVCVTHTTYANCNTGDLSPRETEARIWPPHSRLTHSQAAGRNKRAQGQGRRGLGTKVGVAGLVVWGVQEGYKSCIWKIVEKSISLGGLEVSSLIG